MRISRLSLLSLFSLFLLALPGGASAFIGLDAGVGYWRQTPSGTLNYKGSDIDLKDDMQLDTKSRPFVRIKAELPLVLPNLYFMATPMSFDGSGSMSKSVTFAGTSFDAAVPVDTKLKMDHYDLALFYPIPLLKTATAGKLNVELGLNARQINFDGSINQPTAGKSASKKQAIFLPMLYAGVQVKPLSALSIEAELRGIAYSKNHYYDFTGRVRVKPIGPVFVSAGYRSQTLNIDQKDIMVDMKFNGPFLEAGVNF